MNGYILLQQQRLSYYRKSKDERKQHFQHLPHSQYRSYEEKSYFLLLHSSKTFHSWL